MSNKKRLSLIVASMITLLIIIVFFPQDKKQTNVVTASDGYMDLSGWDFEKNGQIALDGSWEFYSGLLLEPDEIDRLAASEKTYLKVPGRWLVPDHSERSDKGAGTYRLRIRVKDGTKVYGIKTINIRTASKIYVNGKEVGSSGKPALTFKEGYVSNVLPITAFFPAENNNITLVIQVANLDYYNGGIIQSINFGTQQQILGLYFQRNLFDIIVVVSVMLCAIAAMLFFIKLREDRRFLYVSLSCILYAFLCATTNEKIFNVLFPLVPYILTTKLKLVSIGCGLILTSLFIRSMNSSFMPLRYLKAIFIIIISDSIIILFSPKPMTGLLENVNGMLVILIYLLMIYLLVKSIIHRQYGELTIKTALFILGGILILVFDYIASALYFYSIINGYTISRLTYPLIMLGAGVLLSGHYSKMYNRMKKMSNRLIESDQAKDEFLAMTAYEFQMPLHAVLNLTEIISEDGEGKLTEDQEEKLNYIKETAARLSALVNDIIDFESIKDDRFPFHKKIFDINGSIKVMLELLEPMKKSDEERLFSKVSENTYFLHADEDQFMKILLNLTGSFLKYSKAGKITIHAEQVKHDIYIRILHTGSPMDISGLSSDLGLSISKHLISNMDGELFIESGETKQDTCFVIKLPEVEEGLKHRATAMHAGKVKSGLYKIVSGQKRSEVMQLAESAHATVRQKILLVDDDSSDIMVLMGILEAEEYEVLVAYNGIEALELIRKRKDFSLIIVDLIMPGLSGYEVCRRIREEYPLYELPILLLTVRNTSEEIEMGLEAGANDFLAKTYHYKELTARVKTLQKIKETMAKAIKMESVFLQSQIKPHFLYNALNVIISLCYQDGERAGRLLGELSNYLREAFEIDHQNSFISIKRELALVGSYVELEKARFGERLTVEYEIEDGILEHMIPAFTIQPIMENSIRHGLMKRLSGGQVTVTVKKDADAIRIMILDNGVGIPADQLINILEQNKPGSIGLRNVNKRLVLEYGQGLLIESKEGEWTQVSFYIPITSFSKRNQ